MPHSKYQHLYVVLRIDDFGEEGTPGENLSAVSAFKRRSDAVAEADRLNVLGGGQHSNYIVLATRLKGQLESDD